MNIHAARHGGSSWLNGLKEAFFRLFRRTPAAKAAPTPHIEPDRPITSEEMVDEASEESFPASDPPSYTGTRL